MAVKLWWSEKPEYPYEYSAVKELCESLEPRKEAYFVFANYRIPNAQIDLTVFTKTSIFLIELKSSAGKPINGSSNGSWTREDGISLGQGNPVSQILHYYHRLRDWLRDSKEQFLTKNKAAALIVGKQGNAFGDIKKLIVLYPTRHPDSRIAVDDDRLNSPMGNIIGFDKLVNLIIDPSWECRLGITFTPKEIERMAELLHLQPVSPSADTADPSVAPTESLGEARGVYEVHEKLEVPEKPSKETHKPRLLWGAIIAVIIIGIVLFLVIPRSPRTIDVADVGHYMNKIVRVRTYIHDVESRPSASPACIMLFPPYPLSRKFSVRVNLLSSDILATELDRYEKFKGHCVIIGPARITPASSSDNPQIKLSSDNALSYIVDQDPGRCK